MFTAGKLSGSICIKLNLPRYNISHKRLLFIMQNVSGHKRRSSADATDQPPVKKHQYMSLDTRYASLDPNQRQTIVAFERYLEKLRNDIKRGPHSGARLTKKCLAETSKVINDYRASNDARIAACEHAERNSKSEEDFQLVSENAMLTATMVDIMAHREKLINDCVDTENKQKRLDVLERLRDEAHDVCLELVHARVERETAHHTNSSSGSLDDVEQDQTPTTRIERTASQKCDEICAKIREQCPDLVVPTGDLVDTHDDDDDDVKQMVDDADDADDDGDADNVDENQQKTTEDVSATNSTEIDHEQVQHYPDMSPHEDNVCHSGDDTASDDGDNDKDDDYVDTGDNSDDDDSDDSSETHSVVSDDTASVIRGGISHDTHMDETDDAQPSPVEKLRGQIVELKLSSVDEFVKHPRLLQALSLLHQSITAVTLEHNASVKKHPLKKPDKYRKKIAYLLQTFVTGFCEILDVPNNTVLLDKNTLAKFENTLDSITYDEDVRYIRKSVRRECNDKITRMMNTLNQLRDQ